MNLLVKRKKGETNYSLVKRFRKIVLESGIIPEYLEKMRFASKTEKRRRQKGEVY